MKVFITGAAGFIGSHLVFYHLQKGDEVWGLDNLSTGKESNLSFAFSHPRFRFSKDNLLTFQALHEALTWSDRTYHLAAILGMKVVFEHPFSVISENIQTTERVLLAAEKADKPLELLIASSSCVYGKYVVDLTEEAEMKVTSGFHRQETYTASKIANEVAALCFKENPLIHLVIARFFNVIGPNQTGQYGMVVPSFIRQALKNEPLTVHGDGLQKRSFCHITDAIAACEKTLSFPSCKGEIFNIGNAEEVCILDLAKMILAKTKSSSYVSFIPTEKVYGDDYLEVQRRRPHLKKLYDLTGFSPQISLDEALDDLINQERKKI